MKNEINDEIAINREINVSKPEQIDKKLNILIYQIGWKTGDWHSNFGVLDRSPGHQAMDILWWADKQEGRILQ